MKATKWLLAGLLLTACAQQDSIIDNGAEQAARKGVTASVGDFEIDGEATRTTLTLDETYGLDFKWSESDNVGVFGKDASSTMTQSEMAWEPYPTALPTAKPRSTAPTSPSTRRTHTAPTCPSPAKA